MKFFYKGQRLCTLSTRTHHEGHFDFDGHLLALRCGSFNVLIASDSIRSPCHFLHAADHTHERFAPYGTRNGHTGLPGFKGEHQDPHNQGYMLGNGYRTYSPTLMRFVRPDHESPFGKGGVNSYAYVSGDPINRIDPTGRFFELIKSAFYRLFTKKTYQGRIEAKFGDIVVFSGPERTDDRLPTLYINAHGSSAGYISGGPRGAALHDAGSLYRMLKSMNIPIEGRQTHVFACETAQPNSITGRSFIDNLSSMTGAQSSGYMGTVPIHGYEKGNTYVVRKMLTLPHHGTVSTKTRAGTIRNPEKLGIRPDLNV
ncbi:RHS repeat-associated core domain-containing protein [Pseudomonas entomophila]|uniref:RHS repeat-associated core domain-containing protein n=1 Tax=Pseudomonas entomophila TaxID=312306 RepID=UPI0015E40AD0|nr:RHS repeat-associated core domain-containing protein [Pseudomonas entomophila]MBA1193463.1 RHS repeat-associated core domain-containing protein [Pseudomonas entomophila]